MKKNEYIRDLERQLRFRLSPKEIREIISDISEYFDEGAADGRNEGDISSALGSPENAVADILAEKGHASFPTGKLIPAVISLCTAAICLFGMLSVNGRDTWLNSTAASYLILIAVPSLIWLICEGKFFLASLKKYRLDPSRLLGVFLTIAATYILMHIPRMLLERNEAVRLTAPIAAALLAAGTVTHLIGLRKCMKKPAFIASVLLGLSVIAAAAAAVFSCLDLISLYKDHEYQIIAAAELSGFIIALSFICPITFIVSAVIYRNSLSLPVIYLSFSSMICTLQMRNVLICIDPTDILSYEHLTPDAGYIIIGTIFACIFIAAAVKARNKERKSE